MSRQVESLLDGSTLGKRWIGHARHLILDGPHTRACDDDGLTGVRLARRRGGIVSKSKDKNGLLVLDGSRGEGGGQILRTSLTLSLLTDRPFRLTDIRANRDKPGLRPQHLTAVESAAKLCGAVVSGASVGSRELKFRPGPVEPRDMTIDISTAGSTALVLHTLHLPIALRASGPVRLSLVGGTYNTKAPSFPFLDETWRRHLKSISLPIALSMPRAGFFPRGGGRIDAWIEPATAPLAFVSDTRPASIRIRGEAIVARLPKAIGERMRDQALKRLADRGIEAEISVISQEADSPGAALSLSAETEATFATFVGLGERGKPAETVADEAVDELLAYLSIPGAAIDPHSADQLLLPLAFAEGRSVYTVSEVTEHLRTNAETIAAFLDKPIRIEEGTPGRVIVG